MDEDWRVSQVAQHKVERVLTPSELVKMMGASASAKRQHRREAAARTDTPRRTVRKKIDAAKLLHKLSKRPKKNTASILQLTAAEQLPPTHGDGGLVLGDANDLIGLDDDRLGRSGGPSTLDLRDGGSNLVVAALGGEPAEESTSGRARERGRRGMSCSLKRAKPNGTALTEATRAPSR